MRIITYVNYFHVCNLMMPAIQFRISALLISYGNNKNITSFHFTSNLNHIDRT